VFEYGGSVPEFDNAGMREFNDARLQHLKTLGLPIQRKTVLDLGCGIGDLAKFFVDNKCDVLAVDARQENVESAKQRYPKIDVRCLNIEREPCSERLQPRQVVFCYGLLYHLQNPLAGLDRMSELTKEFLLLETAVLDSSESYVKYEEEDSADRRMSLSGFGCRPSLILIFRKLREHFSHVYLPETQPNHPFYKWKTKQPSPFLFDMDWRRPNNGGIRKVIVASRSPLPSLLNSDNGELEPTKAQRAETPVQRETKEI
jgi:SAM-dependent methyltransferase